VSEEKPQPKPYDRDALNDFSRRYADFIFARHPDWVQFAGRWDEHHGSPGILDITIPSPTGDPKSMLYICTVDDEVTCTFDLTHCHFSPWDESDSEEKIFGESDKWLTDFMNEKLKAVIYMKDGKWDGSKEIDSKQEPDHKPDQQVYTKSWRGTYDKKYWRRSFFQKLFKS
jgi:hypothetical protein